MTANYSPKIGIDSHCLSYLLDAMAGIREPTDALRCEKKSLVRLLFYPPGILHVTPTVVEECARIRNTDRRKLHLSSCRVLLDEPQVTNKQSVKALKTRYANWHSDDYDCRIVAEAVNTGLDILASYDQDLLKRLGPTVDGLAIKAPSDVWNNLGISKGAKPNKIPHKTNPLSTQNWWKW